MSNLSGQSSNPVLTMQKAIERNGKGSWKRLPATLCTEHISRCIERSRLDGCRMQRFGSNGTVNEAKQVVLVSSSTNVNDHAIFQGATLALPSIARA